MDPEKSELRIQFKDFLSVFPECSCFVLLFLFMSPLANSDSLLRLFHVAAILHIFYISYIDITFFLFYIWRNEVT